MDEANDPRVYFAAERTLLAWVRTGITVIGLGFVVARFGLFLQILRHDPSPNSHPGSTLIGVLLLGGVFLAVERERPDLTVVGPELPLSLGLADRLAAAGRLVFGPTALVMFDAIHT